MPFPSNLGLAIEFTYQTYGGSGADGFSVFLFDGSVTSGPGADGGCLGYCSGGRANGVTMAYVGIGFDEFGNFSIAQSGPGGTATAQPNHVVIRGSGNGANGYRLLTRQSVGPAMISSGSTPGDRRVRISIINGMITVGLDTGSGFQTYINGYDLSHATDQAALPATFKIGFSGATGGATNVHQVRDLTVALPVDLNLTKTGPMNVVAGNPITYEVTVQNQTGPNPVNDAVVTDDVPASVGAVSWTCKNATGGASCSGSGSGSGNAVDQQVNLPVGGAVTLEVRGTVTGASGSITNTASVAVPPGYLATNPAGSQARATTTVDPSADLAIIQSCLPDPVAPGEVLTCSLTVSNNGPSQATRVAVLDTLPQGVTLEGAPDCTGYGRLSCVIGTVATNEAKSVMVRVRVGRTTQGTITNTATVSGKEPDPVLTNNTATSTTTVEAGSN